MDPEDEELEQADIWKIWIDPEMKKMTRSGCALYTVRSERMLCEPLDYDLTTLPHRPSTAAASLQHHYIPA
jgi:hypothetical protein